MINIIFALDLPNLENDLKRLEDALKDSVTTDDPFLDEVARHLIDAGGKRLRPALAIASSLIGREDGSIDPSNLDEKTLSEFFKSDNDVITGSVAVELVHLASLYHDDVMDEALTRRNVESVNARWGNLVAIVAGDFLLARSAEIAASLGSEIAGLLAASLGRLCGGQVSEVNAAFSTNRTLDTYYRSIAGKTASLMATACHIGALTGGVNRELIPNLVAYGEALGMAFQIRDDILDIAGESKTLGKVAGQDLVEGIYTLPVLLTLENPHFGGELLSMLGKPLDEQDRDKARKLVTSTDAIANSIEIGQSFAKKAASQIEDFNDTLVGRGLTRLAYQLMDDVRELIPAKV
ncbi:MAG: polyprenyl synthetase family protein [Acidimicrobiales bacterium]|nr:polyprenyl synthetase family protein [Acidimicrobiales bacterium]